MANMLNENSDYCSLFRSMLTISLTSDVPWGRQRAPQQKDEKKDRFFHSVHFFLLERYVRCMNWELSMHKVKKEKKTKKLYSSERRKGRWTCLAAELQASRVPPWKIWKVGVSSVSPLSERMKTGKRVEIWPLSTSLMPNFSVRLKQGSLIWQAKRQGLHLGSWPKFRVT